MDKRDLSERDICTKFITPALEKAGWDIHTQVREEYSLTPGPVLVRGRQTTRGNPRRADYVLFYKPGLPLAVIEAKDNNAPVGGGIQQALEYADLLKVPFAFASNGDGFLAHDGTGLGGAPERYLGNDEFPSPDELWRRYCKYKGISGAAAEVVSHDYYRKVDKSYEVYLALYQAISGADEAKDIFRQFSRDFFDLVIIDECHRGSAAENSAWREILE